MKNDFGMFVKIVEFTVEGRVFMNLEYDKVRRWNFKSELNLKMSL